jgi:uncharacterized membrane protein (DUF2068 family)
MRSTFLSRLSPGVNDHLPIACGGNTIARVRPDRGLQLIIAYKFVKGGLWLIFAAIILVMMHLGLEWRLEGLADHLRHHAHAWSLALARLIVRAASRRGLWIIVVALLTDGTLTLTEGWALFHGRWWGPWLVVIATGSLLPFEAVTLFHHPHPVRFAVLVLNLVIVWYLARKALQHHRDRRLEPPAVEPLPRQTPP